MRCEHTQGNASDLEAVVVAARVVLREYASLPGDTEGPAGFWLALSELAEKVDKLPAEESK